MKNFLPAILIVLLLAGCDQVEQQPAYNILFLAADDLNDYVRSLGGHPDAITPEIDKLASVSYVFQNAYCPAPLCNASRAALMSGLNPYHTGVYDNRQPLRLSEKGRHLVTLPQYFRQHGYFVAGAGKMYHNKFPDAASWDEYYPENGTQAIFRPDGEQVINEAEGEFEAFGPIEWDPLAIDDEAMADFQSVQYVVTMLQKPLQEPFFLACGLNKPHTPYFVPEKYFAWYDSIDVEPALVKAGDLDDVSPIGQKWSKIKVHRQITENGKHQEAVKAYLATVSFVDAMIGKVLAALEGSDYADNTIIVFWSDHGFHLGEKFHWSKFTLWEEATKNPLLISFPGQDARKNILAAVSLIDLYPTLVELCDLPKQENLDGHSLVTLLENPQLEWEYPAISTFERGNHAVRFQIYRYIQYHDGSEELYDHQLDSMEWINVAQAPEYQEVKGRLKAFIPTDNAPDALQVEWPEQKGYYDSIMWKIDQEFRERKAL